MLEKSNSFDCDLLTFNSFYYQFTYLVAQFTDLVAFVDFSFFSGFVDSSLRRFVDLDFFSPSSSTNACSMMSFSPDIFCLNVWLKKRPKEKVWKFSDLRVLAEKRPIFFNFSDLKVWLKKGQKKRFEFSDLKAWLKKGQKKRFEHFLCKGLAEKRPNFFLTFQI